MKIGIIGSGLGGLSAAIYLKLKGYDVFVFEKNEKVGGKLNELLDDGFRFDLGPSILTLPYIFEDVFKKANKNFNDYVKIIEIKKQWRNFFEDGSFFDINSPLEENKKEFEKLNEPYENLKRFYNYSLEQLGLIEKRYFLKGHSNFFELLIDYKLDTFKIDWTKTVYSQINKFFKDERIKNAISYFTKYVGSSPLRAPALMNLLFAVQMKYGLWYVEGGMYRLAEGLKKLADEVGVKFKFKSEVLKIITKNNTAYAIKTSEGEFECDAVVSNMEFVPAHSKLLGIDNFEKSKRYEPACSGLVIELGIKGNYENILHHNFFYSKNYKKSMEDIFEKHIISDDPNIYLVNATLTDKTNAPEGYSVIKILPHVSYITENMKKDDYLKTLDKIIEKLERMGLSGLKSRIIKKHILTPYEIQDMYYSNKGSIYGIVSDLYKNLSFRAPRKSPFFKNIYFVGGSTNPGCGMPMAFLSGKILAENEF